MEPADRMVSMAPHDHGRDPRSTGECVRSDERRVPGDVAMWAFILAELLVFALFFSAYAWFRHDERALFAADQARVGLEQGFLDTALLILASAAAAWAVRVARAGQASMVQRARRGLLVASGLALGFLVSKSMDFVDKFHQGLSMSTDDFWLFYFSLTFFHFLHVVLGLVILMLVWHKLRLLRTFTNDSLNWIESGTAYWHMVDLVWIVLFALVYVAR